MPLALIVHGGAGAIAAPRQQSAREGCAAAAVVGWQILRAGGTALDAVTAAIVALEDNPSFNAGTGAVLTRDGVAELDAGIMEGTTLATGAVAGVRRIKNPILLARTVLDSPQVLLIGAGAESFAVGQGMALCDPQVLITADQRARDAASFGATKEKHLGAEEVLSRNAGPRVHFMQQKFNNLDLMLTLASKKLHDAHCRMTTRRRRRPHLNRVPNLQPF